MTSLELVVFLTAVIFGGISLVSAAAASRHYSAHKKHQRNVERDKRRSSAIQWLEAWQEQGLLVIRDEALEEAIYWEKANPEQLEKLTHIIHTLIEKEGLEPGTTNPLVLARAHQEVENSTTSKRGKSDRLELTAAFG